MQWSYLWPVGDLFLDFGTGLVRLQVTASLRAIDGKLRIEDIGRFNKRVFKMQHPLVLLLLDQLPFEALATFFRLLIVPNDPVNLLFGDVFAPETRLKEVYSLN